MDDKENPASAEGSQLQSEAAPQPGVPNDSLANAHTSNGGLFGAPAQTLTGESQPGETTPAQRPLVVRVFIGPDGLRAGWRFFIYLVLVVVLGGVLARVLRAIDHGHRPTDITAWGVIIADAILLAIVLLPSLIMGVFEKRSLVDYYLPLRRAFGRRFWEGAAWGFVAITVLLAGIRATGDFYFGQPELHGKRLLYFAAAWGLAFILVGLAEEYSVRGYSLFTLARGMGFWPAALILSVAFAGLHMRNPGENAVGLLDVVAIALFLCLTVRRTGNLWFAIGVHSAWDWGETFFYGVPNSGMVASGHLFAPRFQGSGWITGGSAGPEGSVYTIVLICVMAALFAIRFRKASF